MRKEGLDYFPLATHFDDEKMEAVEAAFGLKGFALVVKLWQRIYGDKGYYMIFDKRVALMFAKKVGLGVNAVLEIVKCAVQEGIFDRDMYVKHSVLTSQGIQKRYFDAVKRRIGVNPDQKYLLPELYPDAKDVNISAPNVNISAPNVNISSQSRVEERRVDTTTAREALGDFYNYYKKRYDSWCKKKKVVLPESIMVKWYEEDLKKYGPEKLNKVLGSDYRSFDTDDFFQRALDASERRNA